jgi:hypothetical protein
MEGMIGKLAQLMQMPVGQEQTFAKLLSEYLEPLKSPAMSERNVSRGSVLTLLPASSNALTIRQADTIIADAGLGELVQLAETLPVSVSYPFRFNAPQNSYERTVVTTLGMIVPGGLPAEMVSLLEPVLARVFGAVYHIAGARTPEEFDLKMERVQKATKRVQARQDPLALIEREQQTMRALLLTDERNTGMGLLVDQVFERLKQSPEEKKRFDERQSEAMAFFAQSCMRDMQNFFRDCKRQFESGELPLESVKAQQLYGSMLARTQARLFRKIEEWSAREQAGSVKEEWRIIQRHLELILDSSFRIAIYDQQQLMQRLSPARRLTHEGGEPLLTAVDVMVRKLYDTKGQFLQTLQLMKSLDGLPEQALEEAIEALQIERHASELKALTVVQKVIELD